MSWLAILLTLASLGGTPAVSGGRPTVKHCSKIADAAKKKQCKKAAKAKPKKRPATGKPDTPASRRDDSPATSPTQRTPDPDAPPAPTPTATPGPGATPTPTPVVYPSRTGVDLTDTNVWSVRPSYRILAAGRIEFFTTNVGEDDHDLSVRQGAHVFGRLPLAPGESDTLTVDLAAGTYTLYCSLTGHEDAGMRANISVR